MKNEFRIVNGSLVIIDKGMSNGYKQWEIGFQYLLTQREFSSMRASNLKLKKACERAKELGMKKTRGGLFFTFFDYQIDNGLLVNLFALLGRAEEIEENNGNVAQL